MAFELRAWVNLRTNKVIKLGVRHHVMALFDFWKQFKIPVGIHNKAVKVATLKGEDKDYVDAYKGINPQEYQDEIMDNFSGMRNWMQVWIDDAHNIYDTRALQPDKKKYEALMKIVPLPILDKVFPGLWEQTYAQYLIGDILVEELL